MITIDLREFKTGLLQYLSDIRVKLSEKLGKMSNCFAAYLAYESFYLKNLFAKAVEPNIIT